MISKGQVVSAFKRATDIAIDVLTMPVRSLKSAYKMGCENNGGVLGGAVFATGIGMLEGLQTIQSGLLVSMAGDKLPDEPIVATIGFVVAAMTFGSVWLTSTLLIARSKNEALMPRFSANRPA